MARDRQTIEADLRRQTPLMEDNDNGRVTRYAPGDAVYEARLHHWVDTHLAAEIALDADAADAAVLAPLLAKLEGGGTLTAVELRTALRPLLRSHLRERGVPAAGRRETP